MTLKRTMRTRMNDVFKQNPSNISHQWEEDTLHKIALLLRGRSIKQTICCHEIELHDGFIQRFVLIRLQEPFPPQTIFDYLGPALSPEVLMEQINPSLSTTQVCTYLKLRAEAFGQIIFHAKPV